MDTPETDHATRNHEAFGRIQQLEQDLQYQQAKVMAMTQSLSWRITAPLRALVDGLPMMGRWFGQLRTMRPKIRSRTHRPSPLNASFKRKTACQSTPKGRLSTRAEAIYQAIKARTADGPK